MSHKRWGRASTDAPFVTYKPGCSRPRFAPNVTWTRFSRTSCHMNGGRFLRQVCTICHMKKPQHALNVTWRLCTICHMNGRGKVISDALFVTWRGDSGFLRMHHLSLEAIPPQVVVMHHLSHNEWGRAGNHALNVTFGICTICHNNSSEPSHHAPNVTQTLGKGTARCTKCHI